METLSIKYRPQSFVEIVGQEAIVSILSRQIATKTFKNCYLFCGPSGCGKTTMARIMSKEINNHEGEPIEIDAASNNSVDNIRALINDAQQTSLDAEFKTYIIDECHQLTSAAWNAALKLIEEPPSNSIFIFCTTNPDKIPETIMSRVLRFDFKKISTRDITDRLEFILNEEIKSNYERSALERIAILSNGLMREAVSLLDKCLSYSDSITLDNVEKVLGLVKYDYLFDLLNSIKNKDSSEAFNILNKIKYNISYNKLFDIFLSFVLDCEKYRKTDLISVTNIPNIYEPQIDTQRTYIDIIDRIFKFRQLINQNDSETLFNVLIVELCEGE